VFGHSFYAVLRSLLETIVPQLRITWRLASTLILLASIKGALLSAAEPAIKEAVSRPTPTAVEKQSAEAAIRQALKKNVTLWYHSAPLSAVMEDLERKLGVPVRLDPATLKDVGVTPETEVTFAISKVSARAALFHLLSPMELTAITEHESLYITSPQVAEGKLKTKVYDVADLVSGRDVADDEPSEFSALIEVIKNGVDAKSWNENGGNGSISGFQAAHVKAIVVSQTESAHDELQDLLRQLRAIRAARTSGNEPTGREVTKARAIPQPPPAANEGHIAFEIPAAEKAIRLALARPVNLHIEGASLSDAVRQLAKAASVSITVDRKATIYPDLASQRITLDAAGRSLQAALDELARSFKVTWIYSGELLMIVPESNEDSLRITRVYDLADLPAFRNKRGDGVPDYEHIAGTITETVNDKSWTNNGGNGTINWYDKAGIRGIVVSQTWRTHLEIEALLAKLRALRGRPLNADEIKKLPLVPERSEPVVDRPSKPLEADPRRDAVVRANNQFALDLHRILPGDNRIFSPSCLSTAMAMIYTGARGKTATEMAQALRFNLRQEDIAPAYQSLLATLPAANHPGCTLTAANRLWGQQGYGFLEPFLVTTRERFGAGLTEVDFAKPERVCDLVNAWADKNTAGKIKQIIDPSLLTPQSRLVVTSAVYFKGLWAEPFKKEGTRTAPFFTAGGEVDARFMHKVTPCRYGSFGSVKILEKPYRGGEIAMLVLLPTNEPDSLYDLEKSLSVENLGVWTSKLNMETVDLSLPKFKLEATLPLNQALTSLGMVEVFDRKQADLSGMDGKGGLFLEQVLQRAYINVDEEGTEAAAVTAGMGGFFGGPVPEIKVFRADHPFLFLIRDTRTGCILFMGRLAKP
jgi:serpin B